jgi:cytochrome c553
VRALFLATTIAMLSVACTEPKEPIARGQELYDACMPCHGKDAQGVAVASAPEIAGLPEWYIEAQVMKFRAGKRGYHFDDLAGLRMRPMSLSMPTEQDVKDVALYIAQMPRKAHETTAVTQGANVEHGKQLFAACVACHGADGGGNQALNAPELAGSDDWYLLAQLTKFKAKIRGDGAVDPVGATMQAMSMTLPDEQAMKDVVAYIKTLPVPPKKG